MPILLNLCVGLFFVAGLGTAISVPFFMHSKKQTKVEFRSRPTGGGVGQVTITECNPQGKREGESIYFGSQKEGDICGTTESGEEIERSEEYTSLFQEKGDSKGKKGGSGESGSQGKQQCLDNSEQWMLSSDQSSGLQYLGLCGETKVDETKFVKKVQEKELVNNEETGSLGLCTKECGAPNEETFGGTPRDLKEKEREHSGGKRVKFYKS